MAIQTFNKGKFFTRNTQGGGYSVNDYDPIAYQKAQEQKILATPQEYAQFALEQPAKIIATQLYSTNRAEAERLGKLGGGGGSLNDQIARALASNPQEFQKYANLAPANYQESIQQALSGFNPDTADFIAGLPGAPVVEPGRTGPGSGVGGENLIPTQGPNAGQTLYNTASGFFKVAPQAAATQGGTSDSSQWSIAQPSFKDLTSPEKQQEQEARLAEAQRGNDVKIPNKEKLAELVKQGLQETDIIRRDANGNIVKEGGTMYIRSDSAFAKKFPKESISQTDDGIKWRAGLSDTQKDTIRTLIQNKPVEKWNNTDRLNYEFATGEKAPVAEATGAAPAFNDGGGQTGQAGAGSASEGQAGATGATTKDYLQERLKSITGGGLADVRAAAIDEQDVPEKQERVRTLEAEISDMRNAMDLQNITDIKNIRDIAKETIPMSVIQRQQQKYTDDQLLEKAVDIYNYNSKLIEYNMAAGRLSDAQSLVQQSAQDFKDTNTMMLQYLQFNNQIEQQEATVLQKQIDKEYELAKDGYTYISNLNDLAKTVQKYGESRIFTDPTNGKKYLKPEAGVEKVIEANGQMLGLDNKGNVVKNYGSANNFEFIKGTDEQPSGVFDPSTGTFTPSATGMRTDRHFNPIAVSDANPEWQTILQQNGIQFSVGDQFPDNPNLHTLTFPDAETGIRASQVLLGNSNAFSWYKNNTGKQALQGIESPAQFKALSDEQQKNIVKQIYQNEGGSGELFTEQGEVDPVISSYVDLVKKGRITEKDAINEIDENKKDALISELAKTPTIGDTATDLVAKEKIKLSTNLQNHSGLNSSVGPTVFARRFLSFDKLTGERQDFIAGVERLVSGLSLESLIEAKSRGATFGALSDTEMQILTAAATKIGTWRIKDGDGNVVGYDITEEKFKDELNNIGNAISRTIKSNINSQSNTNDPLGIF